MDKDLILKIEEKAKDLENDLAVYKDNQQKIQKQINLLDMDVKQLKKQQDHIRTENYKDYYLTPDKRNKIINRLSETLEQEGTILEIKALNDFKNSGYDAAEYFYVDTVTNKSRQIDILAHKQSSFKIKETRTKIILNLWIVADCKFKSQIDLLCFNFGIKQDDILNFPKFIASDYRFKLNDVIEPNLLITSKITQLVMDANAMKGDHLRDTFIYDSCHQVYSCIKSLHYEMSQIYFNHMKTELSRSSYIRQIIREMNNNEFISIEEIMERLHLVSVYDLLSEIETIYLDAFIPVIIIDESRGILEAELDSNFKLKNLVDKEIALYKFSKGYKLDENDFIEDYIFFVNRNGLTKLFDYLDRYLNKFEDKFCNLLECHPKTIISLFENDARDIAVLNNQL
ncbi:hypothetical protein [Nostoc sp. CMAA1605]|uniref:hypothetical protein n=1 Tax=Nostoc sp. CMAA1605 TaxID=2055159 RepID=UPI001F1B3A34|nr:hypothetical protein [Nostoc sp. CMAA1605]MCF4969440.1 hypothetical protein [Nostoc sp. CMAA1605]